MKIYRPLKSNHLFQSFGESKACIGGSKIVPKVHGACPKGFLSFYEFMGLDGHSGYDYGCRHGEPIYHSGDFEGIAKTELDSAGGIGVDIISKVPILDGNHAKLRYWHLKETKVNDGDTVVEGQLIGLGNSTGASSADHLHFGLKPCDESGSPVFKENGYKGSIDFSEYFTNKFVLEKDRGFFFHLVMNLIRSI